MSYELAKCLVEMGHEVTVLTSRFGATPKFERRDGIEIHRVWSWRNGIHDSGLRGALTYLMAALPALRKILKSQQIDVVHFFFGLPTGMLSFYSHAVRKIPYIVSLRGSDVPLYDRDSRKLMALHRLTRPLSHRVWRNASNVFAVSHGLRVLAKESFPDVDVDVIHNGVDVPDAGEKADSTESDGVLRLVCVSRLIPRKGISDLLEGLASLDDIAFRLSVVGTGPSEMPLRRQAARLGIEAKVSFAGYRAAEELGRYYQDADVFILPTRSDAFANVILEAMAAGLPVIATKVGGVAEAVIDGETGLLVEPRQPTQLAAAVCKLVADSSLIQAFGQAGRQRVGTRFTWANNAQRHLDAYEQAASPASVVVR